MEYAAIVGITRVVRKKWTHPKWHLDHDNKELTVRAIETKYYDSLSITPEQKRTSSLIPFERSTISVGDCCVAALVDEIASAAVLRLMLLPVVNRRRREFPLLPYTGSLSRLKYIYLNGCWVLRAGRTHQTRGNWQLGQQETTIDSCCCFVRFLVPLFFRLMKTILLYCPHLWHLVRIIVPVLDLFLLPLEIGKHKNRELFGRTFVDVDCRL